MSTSIRTLLKKRRKSWKQSESSGKSVSSSSHHTLSTPAFARANPPRFNPLYHPRGLATLKITGIVDWECTATRPFWEEGYPMFVEGREMEEEPEPLSTGDEDAITRDRGRAANE